MHQSTAHQSTWTLPGLHLTDVTLPVPLDHANPSGAQIELFARIVAAPDGQDRPYLVYLQGGPGSEAPRPTDPSSPPWLPRALREHRVVMLDQRGTGRSTPVGPDVVLPDGAIPSGARTLRAASPAEQAEYLTRFRADAIVADAELLRAHLGAERWSLLGQSFGGFTTLRYLSAAAAGLEKALFTGGLPTVGPGMDEVYRTTWEGMIARSERMWARFPGDRDRFCRLADRAAAGALVVPGGRRVGVESLRRLGHLLGSATGEEQFHLLLDLDPDSEAFRHDLASHLPFSGRNPLYAVIHESCWADGVATNWAADRTMPDAVREDPTLLGGEHIHRDLFAEDPELEVWAEAADLLAAHEWPRLYDEDALRAADVPGAAAVYYDDAYVPREFSMATAALLPRLRTWVTSEYEHGGLRASGEVVLDHLLDLTAGLRRA
ncbi:alpha/beta fold hydrolase [Brachybacterium aquaticum]|uniref:Pimeloyl-ACP methyl ester carboxylesterase n=1 Tax=Brachybacterium aquaticum TaxID=1432564 RepID=A0A841AGK7_9MICO|nr:alpha/beta fold hydrolase [Brachybacterium aquaticum]MBB5832465.1 pimeloyl-ACP methyl ester carboxylesterase [Brachybacterium aquaticum]